MKAEFVPDFAVMTRASMRRWFGDPASISVLWWIVCALASIPLVVASSGIPGSIDREAVVRRH
jgi:predicted ATP-dependent protease